MIKYAYPVSVVTFISIVCNSQTVAMIKPMGETIYVGVDTRQGQVSYNDKTKKYDTIPISKCKLFTNEGKFNFIPVSAYADLQEKDARRVCLASYSLNQLLPAYRDLYLADLKDSLSALQVITQRCTRSF